jgi:hypothetical protein
MVMVISFSSFWIGQDSVPFLPVASVGGARCRALPAFWHMRQTIAEDDEDQSHHTAEWLA